METPAQQSCTALPQKISASWSIHLLYSFSCQIHNSDKSCKKNFFTILVYFRDLNHCNLTLVAGFLCFHVKYKASFHCWLIHPQTESILHWERKGIERRNQIRFPYFIFISYASSHSFHFTTTKAGVILLRWKNA